MVRLKEKKEFIIKDNAHISIPYGAIKSEQITSERGAFIEFQFLMVRLKD